MTEGAPVAVGPIDGRLRDDPAFRRFLAAHSITYAGTTLTYLVLPLLAFRLSGSAAVTSAVVALQIGPYLVFGLVAGHHADRTDRQRLMVRVDLVAAAIYATVPVAFALGRLSVVHVLLVAAAGGVCFVWFDAGNFGAVPALVGRGKVVEAMSLQWSIDGVLQIGGPALGGLLVGVLDPAVVLGLDALSYLASAALLASIRRPFRTLDGVRTDPGTSGLWDGARFVWRHPLVRSLTVLGIGTSFTLGALLGLLVPFAVDGLALADDDGRIGLLYSAGAIGGFVGARALPRLVRVATVPTITRLGQVAAGLALVALALQTSFSAAFVLLLVVEGALYLVMMNGIAYRQTVTPDHLLGRVNVLARMIAISGQPVGALLGGLTAAEYGVAPALALGAVGVLSAAVIGLAGPLRLRDHRSSSPAAG